VSIYRYVTEGSFDAYMWQALETKARFISQVITGDNAARRAEDIGGQEADYQGFDESGVVIVAVPFDLDSVDDEGQDRRDDNSQGNQHA
jgi:hypothetical protein